MNITIDRQLKCLATLCVEVPAETVSKERSSILNSYLKQAKIPGFRPGKAPLAVVEKRFNNDIKEEIESRLVSQSFDEVIKRENVKILDFGIPEKLSFESNGTFTFSSTLILAPDFDLPEYKGIEINIPSNEVTEKDINEQLESLRQRFADFTTVSDRSIEIGDFGVVDFSSTLDGKPLDEALGRSAGYLSGRDGFWLKMQEDSFLPNFATQLVGLKIGESREIAITVANDFPLADLREKQLVFQVALKEIKTQNLPIADDEFAQKLMGPDKTVSDLTETISESIKTNRSKEIEDVKINQLIAYFDSKVDFDIPEQLLMRETQSQADALVQRAVQEGMSADELSAQQSQVFETASEQAKTNLKTNFILQEIANNEKIQVSNEELFNYAARIAQSQKQPVQKVIKTLQRQGSFPGIRNSILVSKALDFLVLNASVVETTKELS
jgi:trigger factor